MAALIILTVVLIILAAAGVATLSFNIRINGEMSSLRSRSTPGPGIVVTEEMLRRLPPPVQKYMTYTGVPGQSIPRTIRLKQKGRIRQSAKSAWMRFEAEECYSANPPGFIWKACLPGKGLPLTIGRDSYLEGRGSMLIKMLSLVPLVNVAGSEIDQGAMMRYLNEMMWFPAAFLGKDVSWRAIDQTSAEVTLTRDGQSVSAVMHFDGDGKPLNFVAGRYRMADGRYDLETWSTPFTGYGEFEGLRLPVRGQAVWNLEEGDLVYIELEITRLEYDGTD